MLTGWSAGAASALLAAVWEGALLAGLVWVVLRLLPGLSAAARSVIWLNVFILMALLHLVPWFSPLFEGAGAPGHALAAHSLRLDPRWSLVIGAAWVVLSLVRAGQLAAGALHLRRLGRRAVPVEVGPEIRPFLIHKDRVVELCTSTEVARPSVLGFFRPRILVPPALVERLTAAELKQVVLHEMEHLRRGDDWTNLIQKLGLVLFPLNPALAWVEQRLCAERELACDDRVLSAGSGRKAYALCLARLAEYSLVRRGFGLVLGAWERRPELVRRVHRILSGPRRGMGRKYAVMATGGLVAGALGCTLVLAHAPEVVSFAPSPQVTRAQIASALNVQDVSRALGGTPHMVKAEMPLRVERQGPENKIGTKPAVMQRRAVVRRPLHRTARAGAEESRLASLRTPPPAGTRTLLVLTQWTEVEAAPQVVVTLARTTPPDSLQTGSQTGLQAGPEVMPTGPAIHATYAVVRTPNGWLVIQI
jgi:Zn-dependent protease with chaperone function